MDSSKPQTRKEALRTLIVLPAMAGRDCAGASSADAAEITKRSSNIKTSRAQTARSARVAAFQAAALLQRGDRNDQPERLVHRLGQEVACDYIQIANAQRGAAHANRAPRACGCNRPRHRQGRRLR